MNKEQLSSAFKKINAMAAEDQKLREAILGRVGQSAIGAIPVQGLKRLCLYFVGYLLVAWFLYLVFGFLLPAPTPAEMLSLETVDQYEQIAAGLESLNESARLINLLFEGCFKLFFKISVMAFIFAAALMKADDNNAIGKGDISCAD